MNKGNIIRSIFWGIICLIISTLGIIGLIESNRIFKEYKVTIESVVNTFNTNSIIKGYEKVNTYIKAEIDNKRIRITYDGVQDKEYIYTLSKGYLKTSLDENDSTARMILMVMADSISVVKGQFEGEIYELFTSGETLNYKFEDGISYDFKDGNYIVKLNLDNYIKRIYNENIETPNLEENIIAE